MKLLKKESLEINFPILPIPNNIKDENEFEDITYIQGKSWISLQADDCKNIWDVFLFSATRLLDIICLLLFIFHLKS
mgnify:CR=1 FL=1